MDSHSINLAQKLISFPSVTPSDVGIIDFLCSYLKYYNFSCEKLVFADVINLYAKHDSGGKNLCFAGHTDVVPPGPGWSIDPFAGIIKDNMLFGRGACDMKSAIAAFISAAINFTKRHKFEGSISLLITGDEEGPAINGTNKMLQYLATKQEKLSACIVGEPTCDNQLGDVVKYGRRGSINFNLTVKGRQGHVAYPHLAENAIDKLILILSKLKEIKLDDGNEDFIASHLEITNITTNNPTRNIIPGNAEALFNIRFNNLHNPASIHQLIKNICLEIDPHIELSSVCSAEAFIGAKNNLLLENIKDAIIDVTNLAPKLSTTGGTSDARFIKSYCPVVEFGLINKTAHQIDERVDLDDILNLEKIYYSFLQKFFQIS